MLFTLRIPFKLIQFFFFAVIWVRMRNKHASQHLLVQSQQQKNRRRCKTCSKLTIMAPEWRHWRRSGVFYCLLRTYFTPFASIPTFFDFEHVFVCYVGVYNYIPQYIYIICWYALVIARFRVQYDQYFPNFSCFAELFHEPLGESNNKKIWETMKILALLCEINVR